MNFLIQLSLQTILILWVYSSTAIATQNACTESHDGCIRGCEPINNTYYLAQCYSACGSGFRQCKNKF